MNKKIIRYGRQAAPNGVSLVTRQLRCAIYTRKSCEEGLEQDFNSLDAQREACEAYIKSQQHEGWVLLDNQYNDGGFSGGNLERPALKELFKDIEDGKVDTVVVYKIDRLTRSLMDFSKIVEVFDKQSVTFVSITQQFNTTTSMGRLTLNILLSFAQFEREVTGERIRDKVAASKKKGMWMGGRVPIGYKLENKKLIPDDANIPNITTIFEKYIELESVLKLKIYLDENNIKSRTNRYFSKGNLYAILSNRIYLGIVHHKGQYYEGEHIKIIDEETFGKAQELIEKNRNNNKCKYSSGSISLLAGKLFDDKGNRMTPSHSNTRGKRYRYYISQASSQKTTNMTGIHTKIPAAEIENFVRKEVSKFLTDKDKIQEYISELDVYKQKSILSKLQRLKLENSFIRSIVAKVNLFKDKVDIVLCQNNLVAALESLLSENMIIPEPKNEPDMPIKITTNIRISTTSRKGSVLVVCNAQEKEININPYLVKIIVKSYCWNKLIEEGKVKTSKDIQTLENMTDNDYIKKALNLKFLSPRIVERILNGHQPVDMTVKNLLRVKTLDWAEQERLLNIA